jgi:hypothetical protein
MKINTLVEGKGCSCCGCKTMKECTCPKDCPDCDCHDMNEMTAGGVGGTVVMPIGDVVQSRTKKKKRNSKKA